MDICACNKVSAAASAQRSRLWFCTDTAEMLYTLGGKLLAIVVGERLFFVEIGPTNYPDFILTKRWPCPSTVLLRGVG